MLMKGYWQELEVAGCTYSQEAEIPECLCSAGFLLFLLYSVRDSRSWVCSSHSMWGFLFRNLEMYSDVCPLGDSEPSQIDNDNEPSQGPQ